MKKYVKPDLYFESFQLDQHIAACGYDMVNNTDTATCYSEGDTHGVYPDYSPIKLFATGIAGTVCEHEPELYCYVTGVTTDEMYKILVS